MQNPVPQKEFKKVIHFRDSMWKEHYSPPARAQGKKELLCGPYRRNRVVFGP